MLHHFDKTKTLQELDGQKYGESLSVPRPQNA